MGFMGDSRLYVCNVIQTVLRYLRIKDRASFKTTSVPHTARRRFFHRVAQTAETGVHYNDHAPSEPVSAEKKPSQNIPPRLARVGQRCAMAKRADPSLLSFVGIVPTGPFNFARRELMRRTLGLGARNVTNRTLYRKIETLSMHKSQQITSQFLKKFKKSANYSKMYGKIKNNWGWLRKKVDSPVPDTRAVCVDIIFMVRWVHYDGDVSCVCI